MITALKSKLKLMQKKGMVVPVSNPHYGSALFLILKKDGTYRMVIDMRDLNDLCVDTALLMPNMEEQLSYPINGKLFCGFDQLSGYDYLSVHEWCRLYFVMITILGAWMLCCAPQGWKNSVAIYNTRIIQEVLIPLDLFGGENCGIIQWIDDSMDYARDFEELMVTLRKFFGQLRLKKLRLSISKCQLFTKSCEWCGRVFSPDGWRYSEKYFNKLLGMKKPEFEWQMAQLVFLAIWLSPTSLESVNFEISWPKRYL